MIRSLVYEALLLTTSGCTLIEDVESTVFSRSLSYCREEQLISFAPLGVLEIYDWLRASPD